MARTATRQPFSHGTGTGLETPIRRHPVPDAGRIPVATADFYFTTESRPLIVFVEGRVHLGKTQAVKDQEVRLLLRKKRYHLLELHYDNYSDKKRDQLYQLIIADLGRRES